MTTIISTERRKKIQTHENYYSQIKRMRARHIRHGFATIETECKWFSQATTMTFALPFSTSLALSLPLSLDSIQFANWIFFRFPTKNIGQAWYLRSISYKRNYNDKSEKDMATTKLWRWKWKSSKRHFDCNRKCFSPLPSNPNTYWPMGTEPLLHWFNQVKQIKMECAFTILNVG